MDMGTNDNRPLCATAGGADVKAFAREFNVLGEITRRTGANQWQREFGPATRHLKEFIKETGKTKEDVYLLLIGPIIHMDTYNSIRVMQIEGLNIIPLTFQNVEKVMEACILAIGLRHVDLRNLFGDLSKSIREITSTLNYDRKSTKLLLEWRRNTLLNEQLVFLGVKGYKVFRTKQMKIMTAADIASELSTEEEVKSYFDIVGETFDRMDVRRGLLTFGFACELAWYKRDPILAIVCEADIENRLGEILENIREV